MTIKKRTDWKEIVNFDKPAMEQKPIKGMQQNTHGTRSNQIREDS